MTVRELKVFLDKLNPDDIVSAFSHYEYEAAGEAFAITGVTQYHNEVMLTDEDQN